MQTPLLQPSSSSVCGLHVLFPDFIVEESYTCTSDYLLVSGVRVCGQQSGREVTIALDNSDFRLDWVTDGAGACRGFAAVARQIECQHGSK